MGLLTSGRGRMEMPCLGRAPWAPFQALLLSLTKVSGIPGPPPRHFCSAPQGREGSLGSLPGPSAQPHKGEWGVLSCRLPPQPPHTSHWPCGWWSFLGWPHAPHDTHPPAHRHPQEEVSAHHQREEQPPPTAPGAGHRVLPGLLRQRGQPGRAPSTAPAPAEPPGAAERGHAHCHEHQGRHGGRGLVGLRVSGAERAGQGAAPQRPRPRWSPVRTEGPSVAQLPSGHRPPTTEPRGSVPGRHQAVGGRVGSWGCSSVSFFW